MAAKSATVNHKVLYAVVRLTICIRSRYGVVVARIFCTTHNILVNNLLYEFIVSCRWECSLALLIDRERESVCGMLSIRRLRQIAYMLLYGGAEWQIAR